MQGGVCGEGVVIDAVVVLLPWLCLGCVGVLGCIPFKGTVLSLLYTPT